LFATSEKQLGERNLTAKRITEGEVVYFGPQGIERA
jgi:hypothetical protein